MQLAGISPPACEVHRWALSKEGFLKRLSLWLSVIKKENAFLFLQNCFVTHLFLELRTQVEKMTSDGNSPSQAALQGVGQGQGQETHSVTVTLTRHWRHHLTKTLEFAAGSSHGHGDKDARLLGSVSLTCDGESHL